MDEIIRIDYHDFDGEQVQAVNARDLWQKLEVKTPFHKWIVRRLEEAQLIEGHDFISMDKIVQREIGATTKTEYLLPAHLAQIEAVKATNLKTGVDFSPLLLMAPEQDRIPEEEIMLEPSAIGEVLGIEGSVQKRGRKVNEFLMYIGWQRKGPGGWVPTEEGENHCARHAWKQGDKSGYNLKWRLAEVKKAWDEVLWQDHQ